MKSKRLISILLVLMLVLSVFPVNSAFAYDTENTLVFTIGDVTVPGGTGRVEVRVPIYITTNTGVGGMSFEFCDVPDNVLLTGFDKTDGIIEQFTYDASSAETKVMLLYNTSHNVTDIGLFCNLVFDVDTSVSGTFPVSMWFTDDDPDMVCTYLLEDINTSFNNGSITVEEPEAEVVPVTGISLDRTTAALTVGGGTQLTATVEPADATDKTVTWSSDAPEIAAVNGNGNITAVAAGTAVITAQSSEEGIAASCTVTVEPQEPAIPDPQYGYDETPASEVTVTVTISNDGVPIMGVDGTILSNLEITIPYFDLAAYDLEAFYRYGTENGSGAYVNSTLIKRPTAMHMYIYMLERFYIGLDEAECGTNASDLRNYYDNTDVSYMDGEFAYNSGGFGAYHLIGSATSSYMSNFWGHDENLMYYRNHVYPLIGPGWGSTADYILLSDGDTMNVAMFSNWSFWMYGAFAAFDQDVYTVEAGEELAFRTVKYDTASVADGGTEIFEPILGLDVAVYDADWNVIDTPENTSENNYVYTFTQPGTYYIMGIDAFAKTSEASNAPATAKVVVTGEAPTADYSGYPFSNLTLMDGRQLIDIETGEVSILADFVYGPHTIRAYEITVPEGTNAMRIHFPADYLDEIYGTTIYESYCAWYNMESDEIDWSYVGGEYTYDASGDEIILTVSTDENYGILIEDSLMGIIMMFSFAYGDITEIGGGSTKVEVTSVELDTNTATLDRYNTLQLTASVLPENATVKGVRWSSDNESVATVDNTGLVTALLEGEAVITATAKGDSGITASCTVTVTDSNKPAVNSDTESEYFGWYIINSAEELKWFATEVNIGNGDLNAYLAGDIDLSSVCSEQSGVSWVPIADYADNRAADYEPYSGSFDGCGYTISGLYITAEGSVNNSTYYKSLFGECSGATIMNLTVSGTINVGTRFAAGIVGSAKNSTLIENCHNYVNVTVTAQNSFSYAAGVVASVSKSTVRNCSNYGSIYGNFGGNAGIAANMDSGSSVVGCYNAGSVTAASSSAVHMNGGIAGMASGISNAKASIVDSYNTGTISGAYSGGILGGSNTASSYIVIQNCYNAGTITGTNTGAVVSKLFTPEYAEPDNNYYLEGVALADNAGALEVSAETMKSAAFLTQLNNGGTSYVSGGDGVNNGYPVLAWQYEAEEPSIPTYDMTVSVTEMITPSFYVTAGKDSNGFDIPGDELIAEAGAAVNGIVSYTVKVPEGIERISVRGTDGTNDFGGMSVPASEGASVTMRPFTGTITTKISGAVLTTQQARFDILYGTGYKAVSGSNGTTSSGLFYRFLLNSAGNNEVYTYQAVPLGELTSGYLINQSDYQTPAMGTTVLNVNLSLTAGAPFGFTVSEGATAQVFYQVKNFSVREYLPVGITDNGDGTVTYEFIIATSRSNWTYRVSKPGEITKAGYIPNSVAELEILHDAETDAPANARPAYTETSGIQTRLEDSLMLNVGSDNRLPLNVGETFRLRAYRTWEIINNDAANIMIEPDFSYSIISGGDVVEIKAVTDIVTGNASGNWLDITALQAGTAIVEISYDAIEIGGNTNYKGVYGASDPARTGLVVIQVTGAATDVDFGIDARSCFGTSVYDEEFEYAWDVEYDTLYFTGEYGEMKLSPSAASGVIAGVAVSGDKGDTWTELSETEGAYTAQIVSGNNIIRVTKDDGTVAYQVVRGDKVTLEYINITRPGEDFEAGDTVRINLIGLHIPIAKMSGIYNPGFGQGHRLKYTYLGETVQTLTAVQYNFITSTNYIQVAIPDDAQPGDVFTLTDGYIGFNVMGSSDPLTLAGNNHRSLTDAGIGANFSASSTLHTRSMLPDLEIALKPVEPETNEFTFTLDATDYANIGETVEVGVYLESTDMQTAVSYSATLGFDADTLEFVNVTGYSEHFGKYNNAPGFYSIMETDLSRGPVLIATATFRVKDVQQGTTAVSILKAEALESLESGDVKTAQKGDPAEIDVYDLSVTFKAGTGVTLEEITAFVKYREAGLYTDNTI